MEARALGVMGIVAVLACLTYLAFGHPDAPELKSANSAPGPGSAGEAPVVGMAPPDAPPAGTRARVADASLLLDRFGRLLAGPREPTQAQAQMARRMIGLFNDFDLDAAAGVFEKATIGTEEWFIWLRGRVGECGEGRPLVVRDNDWIRYIHECERGQLEAEFRIDPETGKVPALIMGARGIGLEDAVREAAETVVRLMASWDLELFRRTFTDSFDAEKMRRFFLDLRSERGACSLGATDLASARGALIGLECEKARRLMKIELDAEDRIRTFWIRHPRPTE